MDDAGTTFLHESMPFAATLGIRAASSAPDAVVLELDWSDALTTTGGALHGGAVMGLADAAGGVNAFLNLPDDAVGTSTIESKTNFLGGVRDGTITATATPLHVGGTTIVIETEVRQGDRLIAKVTQTQVVLRPKP